MDRVQLIFNYQFNWIYNWIYMIRLLNLPTWNSASEMFVNLNIPSFGELMRKYIHSFVNIITECKQNSIISSIVNSSIPLISNIWKWWRSILYMKR